MDQGPDLGKRGMRVWVDLGGAALPSAGRLLVEEICRTADRLDRLDSLLRGDEDSWITLRTVSDDGSVVQIVINNLLAEARQQQVAMKQLLAEFRQTATVGLAETSPQAGGSFRDDLRARRAARLADAAGR
jgi:hypothetical protein